MRTLNLTNSVVLDPEIDSAPVVVVYGGLYGWEGAWLTPRLPLDLKQSVIFVLPKHYTNSCARCLKELHRNIGDDKIKSYSLCGYSRGGISVYENLKLRDWTIVGLIDPSSPTTGGYRDAVVDPVKAKIRCVYRMANWAKADYFPKISGFHQHLIDLNVKMNDTNNTSHDKMPSFFFETFRSDFQ